MFLENLFVSPFRSLFPFVLAIGRIQFFHYMKNMASEEEIETKKIQRTLQFIHPRLFWFGPNLDVLVWSFFALTGFLSVLVQKHHATQQFECVTFDNGCLDWLLGNWNSISNANKLIIECLSSSGIWLFVSLPPFFLIVSSFFPIRTGLVTHTNFMGA